MQKQNDQLNHNVIPRDEEKIRKKLLADCRRPAFARLARYTKEVDGDTGETVTRAGVKFVEAALARWGNVWTQNCITDDAEKMRIVRVTITDMETGAVYSREIIIEKTAERARAGKHEKILGSRQTASGPKFIVPATEDDLAAKEAVLTSIVVRQLGLRILPADLVAECMEEVAKTLAQLSPDPELNHPTLDPVPAPRKKADVSRSRALAGALKQRKASRPTRGKKVKGGRSGKKAEAS